MDADNHSSPIPFRKSAPAVLLIIYAVGALIYGHSLLAPFYFDDLPRIVENPHIRLTRLTGPQLAAVPRGQPDLRILPLFTFAANYYFHQYQVSGYRLINLLIHVVNGWLVFCLAWQTLRLSGRKPFAASLLAGLLWLVQPAHIQSVTYVVQRMNSLAALFYLLALVCYIQARRGQAESPGKAGTVLLFAGCGLAGLLGLISRQTVVTLPLFIFLYEWFFFQNLDRAWLKRRRRRLGLALALTGLIAFLCLGGHPVERILETYDNQPFTPAQRLLTQPRVVVYYLSLLAWPHPDRLTLNYDFPQSNTLTEPVATLLALLALAALILTAVLSAKKNRLLSLAVFWFLGNLAIESSVIGLALIFEHRLYLPAVFPAIAAAACLTRRPVPRYPAMALLAALIACHGFWNWQRNSTWQDPVAFWQDGCAKAPDLARPRNDYGMALAKAGRTEEAIAEYEKVIALPAGEKAPAYNNLGSLCYQAGDLDTAEKFLRQAIRAQPDFAKAFMNLGVLTAAGGNLPEATRLLETAVLLDPLSADAHNNLGKIYYESGRIEPAIRHCQRARALDGENFNVANNLGAILLGLGRVEQALPHLEQAVKLSPGHPEANMNIGIAYNRTGDTSLAGFHLFRAVFLAPDNPAARVELGLVLQQIGRYREARAQFEKALELQPDHARARLALASLSEKQERQDE